MQHFKSILCPVDFSDYSELSLRHAMAFAEKHGAHLTVLHVLPDIKNVMGFPERIPPFPDGLVDEANRQLKYFVSGNALPRVPYECMVHIGTPDKTILKIAEERRADLIVMGSHGRTGYEKFLLGSVTYKLLHKSATPVLVVPKKLQKPILSEGKPATGIKKILCPLDFGTASAKVSAVAHFLTNAYESELYLLHVADKEEDLPSARKQLEKYAASIARTNLIVERGNAAERILEASELLGIDLIVIGHHTRLPLHNWFLGSVALRVIAEGSLPALVIRG